jgi:hypothetical protein
MHISEVKTAIRIGHFESRNDSSPNHIKFIFGDVDRSVLRADLGRVYIFTSDGTIVKIGGSKSVGGIRTTLGPYISSMGGSPGKLIHRLLLSQKAVECYMITSPSVVAQVNGLFGTEQMEISSFSEMENKCMQDYFDRMGKYPAWNYKENRETYPNDIIREYTAYNERWQERNQPADS